MTDTTAPTGGVTPISAAETAPTPLRWRLSHRPDVRFGHAAGGVAGILVAAATIAFVAAVTGDDPTLPGVAFTAGLIGLALLAGWRVRGPVRSAAVAAVAIAVPFVWLFAVLGDGGGSRGDVRLVLLLSVAAYVALYLLTWTRGRAILLGLTLLFAASWFVFEVARQEVPFAVDIAGQAQGGIGNGPDELLTVGDRSRDAAAADLIVAAAFLGAGMLLDHRRTTGAATPFLLVGGLYAVNAAIAWGIEADDVYAAGVFVAIAGLLIGLAGSLGRRRGTSWIGAVVLLAGALAVIAQATTDAGGSGGDDAAWRFGVFALVGAALLLSVGIVIARGLAEPVDGGEPAPPAAEPPDEPPAADEPTPDEPPSADDTADED